MCHDKRGGKNAHDVILQVLTDARKIQLYVDASSSQDILRSNPAVHQYIGTSYRTSGQQNLLENVNGGNGATLAVGKLDAGGSEAAIEKNIGNGGIDQDVQIWARRQRVNVCGA